MQSLVNCMNFLFSPFPKNLIHLKLRILMNEQEQKLNKKIK